MKIAYLEIHDPCFIRSNTIFQIFFKKKHMHKYLFFSFFKFRIYSIRKVRHLYIAYD